MGSQNRFLIPLRIIASNGSNSCLPYDQYVSLNKNKDKSIYVYSFSINSQKKREKSYIVVWLLTRSILDEISKGTVDVAAVLARVAIIASFAHGSWWIAIIGFARSS